MRFAAVTHLHREQWLTSQDPALRQHMPTRATSELRDVPPSQFPAQPSGVYPFIGWLWSDFFVHDHASHLHFNPGRGFVFGRPVTEAVFKQSGLVAVIRAHQHNGQMMEALRINGGVVDNWHGAGAWALSSHWS